MLGVPDCHSRPNACAIGLQVWCETNLRRCISKFHRFVCDCCDKAFPLRSALDIHKSSSHPDKTSSSTPQQEEEQEDGSVENQEVAPDLVPEQASFLEGLGLQHVSKVNLRAPQQSITALFLGVSFNLTLTCASSGEGRSHRR